MNKLVVQLLFIFFIFISLVHAEIFLDLNVQNSFSINENLSFTYSLTSDSDVELKILPGIMCRNIPIAPLDEKIINLSAGKVYTDSYQDQVVQNWFGSQTCTAYVRVLSPVQKEVSKNFSIASLNLCTLDIELCKTSSCTEKSKVFNLHDSIYLNYHSSIQDAVPSGNITYPDGTIRSLSLPFILKAEQIGAHTLNVNLQGSECTVKNIAVEFAVIEKPADIQESTYNSKSSSSNLTYLFVVLGVILTIIVVFVVYSIIKRNRCNQQLQSLNNEPV
jgi:hypothetical protein